MQRMAAVIAVAIATAVLAVGAAAAPVRQGSGAYVCGYGHSTKAGVVYVVLGVKPKSLGPVACKSFNSTFHGKKADVQHQLGTGTVYCKYKYVKSSFQMVAGVFAQTKSGGKQFCAAFHPKGWKKF